MNTPHEEPMKAYGIEDLLYLLPNMLGYHPTESLAVVSVVDGKVEVCGRIDITGLSSREALHLAFGTLCDRYPDAAWMGVAYTDDESLAWHVLEHLEQMLDPTACFQGIAVVENIWHVNPLDPGAPYEPESSVWAAEAVYRGLTVLPSRQALIDTLAPSIAAEEMGHQLDLVLAREPASVVAEASDMASSVLDGGRCVGPREAAHLAVAAYCPDFADSMVYRLTPQNADAAVALWTAVVRMTSRRVGASAAVLLGLSSWVSGCGTMQSICLERAEKYVGQSRWYQVLTAINRSAAPPTEWGSILNDLLVA